MRPYDEKPWPKRSHVYTEGLIIHTSRSFFVASLRHDGGSESCHGALAASLRSEVAVLFERQATRF